MSDLQKYAQPKILLVDLGGEAEYALKNAGYNVSSGSFGVPYNVLKNDDHSPVISDGNFPDFTEQEVVVNLVPGDSLEGPLGRSLPPPESPIVGQQ